MYKSTALFLSVVLLAACSSSSENLQGQLTLEEQNEIIDPQTSLPEFSAEYQLNEEVIMQALDLGTPELCETITDQVQKKSCLSLISDSQAMQTAIDNLDLPACDNLASANMQERCAILVSAEIEKVNEQKVIDAMAKSYSKAVNSGELELCEVLEDSNFRDSCVFSIKTNLAISEKDPSHCQGLNENAKALCEKSI